MSNKLAYSSITTKVKAMSGKLLTNEQYQEIAGFTSIPELVSYLKNNTSYFYAFDTINEQTVHRMDLEKVISNSLYSDFSRLYKFSNATQRKFLTLYFLRYEVAIVKECLCSIFDHNNEPVDLSRFYDFFKDHSKIDVLQLATVRTIDELIENLKGSNLYPVLMKLKEYTQPTLMDYEMHLDLFYFQEFWKSRKKFLSGDDLYAITDIYGKKIDLLNIQWITRAKKHFNLTPSEIYKLIIPIQYKLKSSEFHAMVGAENIQALSTLIHDSYYGSHLEGLDADSVEDTYLKLQNILNSKSSRLHPYSVAILNSYLYKKEREKNRLITAIECIRYNLNSDQLLVYITK